MSNIQKRKYKGVYCELCRSMEIKRSIQTIISTYYGAPRNWSLCDLCIERMIQGYYSHPGSDTYYCDIGCYRYRINPTKAVELLP